MMLDDLTSEEMSQLEAIGRLRVFAANDVIVQEGDSGSSFFLLLSGRAEVRKNVSLVAFRKLTELGPCSIFGEVCFLGVTNRSASVVAVDECRALEFFRFDFEAFSKKNPHISAKIYRGIARELAERLIHNNEELRKAILWALDEMKDRNQITISPQILKQIASGAAEVLKGAPDAALLGVDLTKQGAAI